MTRVEREAKRKLKAWRDDPVRMVVDEFKAEPDTFQVDFLRAFADPEKQRIALKACKGPGKTAVLSWGAWNFLGCYPHCKIGATSITGDNLDANLWPEMAKWQKRSEFFTNEFTWSKRRISNRENPEDWFMDWRAWPKGGDATQQADSLAGLHADNVMFILDEAGGIPDAVAAAAEGVLANEGGMKKIIIAGNPTHLTGPLYHACTNERHLWTVIEITGDPDDPKRCKRISIKWAQEQIFKYGKDNPWVLVNVYGKFPPSSINALLGPDDVEAAMNRRYRREQYEESAKTLGVDVARFGDDESIIFPRQGIVAFIPRRFRNLDGVQLAGNLALAEDKFQPDGVFIDCTGGFGSSCYDHYTQVLNRTAHQVIFSSAAKNPRQYANLRAEMLWDLAQWVKNGGALPNIPELKAELCALEFTFTNKSQIIIIDKDDIKAKIGRSPDLTDGLATTFAFPIAQKQMFQMPVFNSRRRDSEYDPIMRHYDTGYSKNNVVADYDPLSYKG